MSLAAGACEAVFLGKSFQGCVPCHSLILPPASGCRLYHPASLQKRPEVSAPVLCTPRSVATDRTSPRRRSGCVARAMSQTPLGWVESIEGGFQSLNPRSWRSSRRLRGCRERLLTQNALWGSGTARHLGPTPRGRLKFGCEHVCRTRTARNRRVKDARRSVAGPPSAVLAGSLPVAHFGVRGRKPRILKMPT